MGPLSWIKEAIRHGLSRPPMSEPGERPWWDFDVSVPRGLEARVGEYVVSNRVFLLGLDELYRSAMKEHERSELLACAQSVAAALRVGPAEVPVEGYYTDGADLTTYFRLMRALQDVPLERALEVESLPQFHRLLTVTSSPIYGRPIRENLLPTGRDPLSAALKAARSQEDWTVPLLTAEAARVARETDDCSLVGVASRAEDPIVLTALRESVVLYAERVTLGGVIWPKFVWQVDPELSAAAQRFVDTFNALFGRALPPATAQYAHVFGGAGSESQIAGRCVRLGQTDEPQRHYYHWAVVKGVEGQLAVNDFWASEIWTTERYRRGHAVRDVAQDGRRLPHRSM